MMTVYKYDLDQSQIGLPQIVLMPKGAIPIALGGPLYGWARMWAIVDTAQILEERKFVIAETGGAVPVDGEYIATVSHLPQIKAWHLFEIKPKITA